jgi:hypothetical protein
MARGAARMGRRASPAAPVAGGARQVLGFPGLARRVALTGAAPVAQALAGLLCGWAPVAVAQAAAATRVTGTPRGYRVESDYLEGGMHGLPLASAVCAVIADLAQAWAEDRPRTLALHAGAVRTGAGLVVLAGPARAGKSTLVARLGLEPGWQVFCDDVLPVAPGGQGVALGIPPRLRLPVPVAAGPAVQALATTGCTLRDDRYGYVALPDLAPHGMRAPLRALIVLDRRPGAAPCLHDLPKTEAVRLLADQTIVGAGLPALMRLADRLTCLRLVYEDLEPAAALLGAVLASPQALSGAARAPALAPALPETGAAPLAPAGMDLTWRRSPGLVPRRLADGLALWSPDHGRALVLNPTGAAVWGMLAFPVTGAQMAQALAGAFPEVPPDRIRADVAAMMGGLVAAGLVAAQAP